MMHWYGNMCVTLPWPNRPWKLNTAISDEVYEFSAWCMHEEREVLAEALTDWLYATRGQK